MIIENTGDQVDNNTNDQQNIQDNQGTNNSGIKIEVINESQEGEATNNNQNQENPIDVIRNDENTSNQQQEEPEQPQSNQNFNFVNLGLPENFLEVAEIDPTFFYALPEDLQTELALQHGEALNLRRQPMAQTPPPNPENQQNSDIPNLSDSQRNLVETANNNMIFLSSLAPDMREEVLLSCPDEFLLSLPNDIQEEARRIRAANIINNDFY